MRVLRALLAFACVALVCPLGAGAVDGVNEINQTSIVAAGGFPYTIAVPGSYVLTGDLTPLGSTGALVLGVDNVTIDLNGFTITSPGGGGAIGINSAGFSGLTVRNGVVQGFGGAAIAAGPNSKVIETKLTGNGAGVTTGVVCLIVMNTIATNGGGAGITASNCKIENNVIEGNGGVGITGPGNVIVHNRIGGNAGGGIFTPGGSKIQENVITTNAAFGISDGVPPPAPVPSPPGGPPRNNIIGNVIDNNFAGPGITIRMPALITDNTVTNNFADGVICGASCTVNGNVIDRNNLGPAPGAGGLTVAAGSTVHSNSISYNQGFGLMVPLTSSYTNNTITGNGTPVPPGAGPNVIVPPPGPPHLTGGFGNNCAGVACP